MTLSIITASYNSEIYISECLSSTKGICEISKNVEHIVFDGGSIDNTLKFASSFDHVKIIQSSGDKGVYDAFNKAVPFTNGKYILYLNSDDKFSCTKVKELIKLLEVSNDLWFSGFINFIDGEGKLIKKDVIKKKLNFNRFLISNTIRHPATFVRREYLLKNKFDLKYSYAADYAFFLKLWSSGNNPNVVPWIISSFRIWESSLSSNFEKSIRDEFLVRQNWRESSNSSILLKMIDSVIFYLRLLKLKI